ncbi:alpha/beta hydrolase [Nocardioides gansuensis]|nr:alpha/beta hydrolase [Nocardioides gansuensis]
MTGHLSYGPDPSQWVELHRPDRPGRGVVAVIHGGFWKAAYDASLGQPLALDLAARGWTALNVEYRRVGNGGGFPETFDDVAAALALLRDETGPLVTLGHSAGGHLATWAAARTRFDRWAGGAEVTHVVSQAGVLDLSAAHADALGSGAAQELMGEGPGHPSYSLADPTRHVPLDVPVWCVHARDDEEVPFSQSADYVTRATAAGARAELVEVPGGHYGVIDTRTEAWARIVEILDDIA